MPIIIPDNLPYTAPGIECLRFGARRGGTGIGCCAVDVFQGFNNPPTAHCPPIPFFDGDSYTPIEHYGENGSEGQLHLSGTNEDVFLSYLTHGSFTQEPEPDHAFIAILTDEQIRDGYGKDWMRILKREGFKWVGATSNSVYSEYHPNHIFILIRKTGEYMNDGQIERLERPPQGWEEIPEPTKTPEQRFYELCEEVGCCFGPAPAEEAPESPPIPLSSGAVAIH